MLRLRAPWPVVLAAASFLAYFALLLYCDLTPPEAEGLSLRFDSALAIVASVTPGSPADRAGIRVGDQLISYDGLPIRALVDWMAVQANTDLNRPRRLELVRTGQRQMVSFALEPMKPARWTTRAGQMLLAARAAQAVTLLLAIVVAFRRPRDPVALLGAWLMATFGIFSVVLPSRIAFLWRGLPSPVAVFLWAPFLSSLVLGAVLFTFFANFPALRFRSVAHWAMTWAPMLMTVVPQVDYSIRMVYWPETLVRVDDRYLTMIAVNLGYCAAGIGALALRYRRLEDINQRRRARVLAAGTLIGCAAGAIIMLGYWRSSGDVELFASPLFAVGTLVLLVLPASFTVAILRHRLFDIRIIVRQGLQYALARRLLLSIVPAATAVFAIDVLLHRDRPVGAIIASHVWGYGALVALVGLAHARRQAWLEALDRRFFRDRYDVQRLLRQVSDEIRNAVSFEHASPRVVAQIEAALHARFVALLVRRPDASAFRAVAAAPEGSLERELPRDAKVIALLKLMGKPVEVPLGGTGWLAEQLPRSETALLQESQIELLVPVTVDVGPVDVILALGTKRSEDPYSRDDLDLLMTVADTLAQLVERTRVATPESGFAECPQCGHCFDSDTRLCAHDGAALDEVRSPRWIATRYRLERRLGRGGMGTVYAALDTVLQRDVALKLIREDRLGQRDIASRFQREARIAASFVHPNVVTIFDSGLTTRGQIYIVMELLEGLTLREAIARDGRLLPARAAAIMRGVTAAVDLAHQRQLVHRDLKPENIILVQTGEMELPKILDFGIAKLMAPRGPDAATTETDAGQLVGTLAYMAPEQLRGEPLQPAWDLWALSVLAYEMIVGAHPFAAESSSGIPLWPGPAVRPPESLPPACREFFARALAIDPEARPASAAELFIEFARALDLAGAV